MSRTTRSSYRHYCIYSSNPDLISPLIPLGAIIVEKLNEANVQVCTQEECIQSRMRLSKIVPQVKQEPREDAANDAASGEAPKVEDAMQSEATPPTDGTATDSAAPPRATVAPPSPTPPNILRVNESWVRDCVAAQRFVTSFFMYAPEVTQFVDLVGEDDEEEQLEVDDEKSKSREGHDEDGEFVLGKGVSQESDEEMSGVDEEDEQEEPPVVEEEPEEEAAPAKKPSKKKKAAPKKKKPSQKKRKRDAKEETKSKASAPSKKKRTKSPKKAPAATPLGESTQAKETAATPAKKIPLKPPSLLSTTPQKKKIFISAPSESAATEKPVTKVVKKVVKKTKKKGFKPPSMKSPPAKEVVPKEAPQRKKTVKKVAKENSVLEEED